MKYLELLLEKLNGWMEPFPKEAKEKSRKKLIVVVVYVVFVAVMIFLTVMKNGHK